MHEESNIKELIKFLWHKKKSIFIIFSISFLASTIIAFNLPKTYSSYTTLQLADSQKSGISTQGMGLSSLAFSSVLPGVSNSSKLDYVIEVIKSRDFFSSIADDNFIEMLINKNISNTINLENNFDDIYFSYLESLKINKNNIANIIKIEFLSAEPLNAKLILEKIIQELNKQEIDKEKNKINNSINFLDSQKEQILLQKFSKDRINNVINEKLSALAIVFQSQEYLVEVLDSPRISYKPTKPHKKVFVFLFVMFSTLIHIIILLIIREFKQ